MFKHNAEKYVSKQTELTANYKKVQATDCKQCLNAGNTVATIRESFRFIKSKEDSLGKHRNIIITMGVFIKENQSNIENKSNFGITSISGIITKVCRTYAELSYTNNSGQVIKTVVSYDGIIVFGHPIINEYIEEYIKTIDILPYLCKDKNDESYQLLERLSSLLEFARSETMFTFVINGVLTGNYEASNILILRNLIILNENFVVPITQLSSFAQVGYCEE